MRDWNAVISVREGGFTHGFQLLKTHGLVQKTEFYNILVMRADDPLLVLKRLHDPEEWEQASRSIGRFMPLERLFTFQSPADFELRLKEVVSPWLFRLANSSFHVRMHRRGFKGRLSSADEERLLDTLLLDALVEQGTPGKISFKDPDIIIALETLGPRAGLSMWDRPQLQRFPLLHLD